MRQSLLEPRIIRMPEFAPGQWLNVERPLTREQLYGQVVLIDFWEYTCINCIRTLPYLRQWHKRYADKGLVIIGVHSPEFRFARFRMHIETAVADFQLPYPILLDNDLANWELYANKAWPTKYLIDSEGYIRYQCQGEGAYQQTERAIRQLLRQRDPSIILPDKLVTPIRDEDQPGAACYRPTPELYAGYRGGGLFAGGLGNPEGYVPLSPVLYEWPDGIEREEGHFYVEGIWRAWPEAMSYAGKSGGRIVLPYRAVTVNAVLSPSPDPVETVLDLRKPESEPVIEVKQDGRYLNPANAGRDITFRNGKSIVLVDRPRMYELVNNSLYGKHELSLTFHARGLAVYAFSFTTCADPTADLEDPNVFQTK
ncbi:MAG: hypothetical protein D6706_19610 [Chloroflexi bacterium]|nr:MAG: hypothetical protein D6706_19610 [Chloroflexota bacterium]